MSNKKQIKMCEHNLIWFMLLKMTFILQMVSLHTDWFCDQVDSYCSITDLQLDEQQELIYPDYADTAYLLKVENIKFSESTLVRLTESMFNRMPNLKNIDIEYCSLEVLDVNIFGEENRTALLNILKLNFGNNELTHIQGKSFTRVSSCKELNFDYNQLSSIDKDAFDGLHELEILQLSHNSLRVLDVATFSGLVALRDILITDNNLQTFDFNIFQHNENFVDLEKNQMKTIQSKLINDNIKRINLQNNILSDITALKNMKNLEALFLSGNIKIKLNTESFTDMLQLKELHLAGTNLKRLNHNYTFLEPLKQLEVLNLGKNALQVRNFDDHPTMPNLKTMLLYDNKINFLNFDFLKEKVPKLKGIDVSNNDWNCNDLEFFMQKFAELGIVHYFYYAANQKTGVPNVNGVVCRKDSASSILLQQKLQASIKEAVQQKPENVNGDKSPQANNEICGKPIISGAYIFGGVKVTRGTWPWLVSLNKLEGNGTQYLCGATLLTPKLVVTAAHCLVDWVVEELVLFIGRHDLTNKAETNYQTRGVNKLIIHPDYNKNDDHNADADIGLIIMNVAVVYDQYVRPVCLWPEVSDKQDILGLAGAVIGWGFTANARASSAEPLYVKMPVVADDVCLREDVSYHFITSERTFCAGEKNGRGPCFGDSGSGFFIKHNEQWMIRGLVSTGLPDTAKNTCNLDKYVVFTDVAQFITWIKPFLNY